MRRRKEALQQQLRASDVGSGDLDEKALKRLARERLGLLVDMTSGRRDEKVRQALASYVDQIVIEPRTKTGYLVLNAAPAEVRGGSRSAR